MEAWLRTSDYQVTWDVGVPLSNFPSFGSGASRDGRQEAGQTSQQLRALAASCRKLGFSSQYLYDGSQLPVLGDLMSSSGLCKHRDRLRTPGKTLEVE